MDGKLDGMALRVPISNGSVADLVLTLKKEVTKEDVNSALKDASQTDLKGIWHTQKILSCLVILLESHVPLLSMV